MYFRAPKFYGLEESDDDTPTKSKKRKERKRKKNLHDEGNDDEKPPIPEKKVKKEHIINVNNEQKPLSYEDKLRESLKGSRFRYINEQLYTTPSSEAMKIFEEDESAFSAYHEGYRHQISQWPMNPLDRIIKQINKM